MRESQNTTTRTSFLPFSLCIPSFAASKLGKLSPLLYRLASAILFSTYTCYHWYLQVSTFSLFSNFSSSASPFYQCQRKFSNDLPLSLTDLLVLTFSIADHCRAKIWENPIMINHGCARRCSICFHWLLHLYEQSVSFHHACMRLVHERLRRDLFPNGSS